MYGQTCHWASKAMLVATLSLSVHFNLVVASIFSLFWLRINKLQVVSPNDLQEVQLDEECEDH